MPPAPASLEGSFRSRPLLLCRKPVGKIGSDGGEPGQLLLSFSHLGGFLDLARSHLRFDRSELLLEPFQPAPEGSNSDFALPISVARGFQLIDPARQRALRRSDRAHFGGRLYRTPLDRLQPCGKRSVLRNWRSREPGTPRQKRRESGRPEWRDYDPGDDQPHDHYRP